MKEWSEKEDQIKKEDEKVIKYKQLWNLFDDGDKNKNQINILLSKSGVEVIDYFLRRDVEKYESEPEKNIKMLEELFSHADLNYINSNYNDTNILMSCCEKGEPLLIDLLLEEKYYAKKIDLFKVDKNNENILHYLFNRKNFDVDIDKIFEKIMIYATSINKNKNRVELLIKEDKNGITPLVIILKKGWCNILKLYFKYFEYKPHIIKSNKNNYIHCAIDGGNIKCLISILNHCTLEELNQTNSNGLTPSAYAKEKKYYYMSELIKEFQNNYNNEEFKNILMLPKIDSNDIIKLFVDKNYSDVQKYLYKYKINQSINVNVNNKYSNISFEWNSLLTKRLDAFNKGITPEHILSKFIKNNKNNKKNNNNNNSYQNKKNVIATLYEFNKFFNKYINENVIKDHIDEEYNYSIDIVVYNKIIYYYKICDYDSFLKYINLYFTNIYPQCNNDENDNNDKNENNKIRINNYYKFITFVNISFLLIEYFIKDNNEQFCQIIMDELEKYFTKISPNEVANKKDKIVEDNSVKNSDKRKEIIKYLNNNEILNPLNNNLDDSLCYLYLLEIYYIIKFNSSKSEAIKRINKLSNIKFFNLKSKEENEGKEEKEEKEEEDEEEEGEIEDNNIFDDIHIDNNKNNAKILNNSRQIIKKVKIFMKNSNLANFADRSKLFYYELKSYLYYLSGDINKSNSKIFNIKKKLEANNIKSNEHKMFYYNSQGIINLRLKKYSLAEHFFKLGINLFKLIHNNLNTPDSIYHNDIVINKSEYLYKMKYNLGLSYFYNNNYKEAFNIFNELKDIQEIKNNIFFWFRFGLTSLNLYLFSLRKLKQKRRKYYQDLNNHKQKNDNEEKTVENDSITSEKNSIDELYEEYLKIYGKETKYEIETRSNKMNAIFIENNNTSNKKIINENHLDISINSFKKVLKIYKKMNLQNENKKAEDLKFIFNFYTKNIGETKEFKNMINKQNTNKKSNIPKSLIYSCYLNLLFSYHLKKKYLEIILLIKNIKKEKIILSNSIKRKIKYYELLALINLNRNKNAEDLINDQINKYGNIDKDANNDFDCFNVDDCQIEKDINHKILLQIGQVFIYCRNKNYEKAENKLLDIIKNNYNGNEDISRYYYQLMIYILSSQNKKNKTINLIKYRWTQIQNSQNNINNNTHYYEDNNG